MDIFGFALQMEKDGEAYYRDLAGKSTSPGLKKIFNLLADEEERHYAFITLLQQKIKAPQLKDAHVLKNVKNIFIDMKSSEHDCRIDATNATAAYKKALAIEEKSKLFYLEKATESKDEQICLSLNRLAQEEEKHMRILENIIEFVSRPEPGNWLENAEWHHLDEY